jgi:DNA-binding MarR family transcriptional regulator
MHSTIPITVEIVKNAVTIEQLAEDMEHELLNLFPKHSDQRFQAVQLLMHLQEHGPQKQSELTEALGIEPYAMSRLLAKLELHRYVTRRRGGADKLVSLPSLHLSQ